MTAPALVSTTARRRSGSAALLAALLLTTSCGATGVDGGSGNQTAPVVPSTSSPTTSAPAVTTTHSTRTGTRPVGSNDDAAGTPSTAGTPTASTAVDPALDAVLPADRRTTWNPGVTYGGGGIPTRETVCTELAPSGADDTAAIQAALNDCPDDQVVQLTAGTFEINGDGLNLRRSRVTLRGRGTGTPGSGEGGTRLIKADRDSNPNSAILYVGSSPNTFNTSIDLARDGIKGSNQVTLEHDPGLEVGELVLIDHVTNDDPDVVWGSYHDAPGEGSRRWFDRQDRSLSQILEITKIDGTTVTFATPLHWTFKTGFAAQLSRYGSYPGGPVQPFLEWVGIEDIYFSGGMGGDYHGNIAMMTCAYCWIRNIESDRSLGTAVGLYGTYRSEIRDSYIHSTADPNPGGGGYLTGIHYGAADNLIENNVIWNGNKMIVMRASGGGNVVGYNFMQDGYGLDYREIQEVGLNAGHYTTPHMELLEGNESFNFDNDSYWGNSISITVFRNLFTGTRANAGGLGLRDEKNRRMASLNHYSYNFNFVGNVLGSPDMKLVDPQTRFVDEITAFDDEDVVVPVWTLGYVGEDPGQPFDPKVAETTLRQGNYDFVGRKTVWQDGQAHVLPPSLYQHEKPAFFGTSSWPWINPETPDHPVASLPAHERFDSMPGH